MGNEIQNNNGEKKWIVAVFRGAMSLATALSVFLVTQVWQWQQKLAEGQLKLADRLNAMDVATATTLAGKFTAADWATAKALIDAQFNLNDKRIFRLESAQERIEESLKRIEKNIGTKQP